MRRAALRRLPALPARVLRPAATGQVVSRATNDLYPIRYFIGWGSVQDDPERDHDRRRAIVLAARWTPRWRSPPASACRSSCGWPGASRARDADLARHPPAEGRRHGGRRRGRRGHRDGAGVRPRGRRPRALRRPRRGRPRQATSTPADVEARYLPGLLSCRRSRSPRSCFFGGREVIDGRPDDRRVRALPDGAAAARVAARGARLDHRPRPARDRLGRPQLRLARRRARAARARPAPGRAGRAAGRALEGVRFAYAGASEVLQRRRPRRRAGRDRRASAGPPASGKTSLLGLVPRFYDPTAGRGPDRRRRRARRCALAELRGAVAIVTQRPVLFSVPLRENLVAGRPDAPWDDVLAACEAAGVAASSTTCRTATTR